MIQEVSLKDGISLYYLNELPSLEYLENSVILHPEELLTYAKIRVRRRRTEWLATRYILSKIRPSNRIVYLPSGKPQLAHGSEQLAITHTDGFVAIAIGQGKYLGIDTERHDRKFAAVAPKYISETELALRPHNFPDEIFEGQVWRAKEAVYKAIGQTGVDFKVEMQVQELRNHSLELRTNIDTHPATWEVFHTPIGAYILSWTSQ
ncbi:MAG: hypothetical protein RIS47_70 [Bacteroidota bacterium]